MVASKIAPRFEDCTIRAKIACAATLQSSKVCAIYVRGRRNIAEIRYCHDSHRKPDNSRDSIGARPGLCREKANVRIVPKASKSHDEGSGTA